MSSNLTNLEALLNIIANGLEIFGIAGGFGLFIGGISILFLKKWSVAVKLIVIGVVTSIIGLSAPQTINWIIASMGDAGIVVVALFGLVLSLVLMFGVGFLPTIVAFKRQKANRKLILVLNILLSLIPFGWNIALFMAFMNDKEKTAT